MKGQLIAGNASYISLYCFAADAEGYVAERFADRLPNASVGKTCVRPSDRRGCDPAGSRVAPVTPCGTRQTPRRALPPRWPARMPPLGR